MSSWDHSPSQRVHGAVVTDPTPTRETRDMREITRCVICGRRLKHWRQHVDTCRKRCFERLLERQRQVPL